MHIERFWQWFQSAHSSLRLAPENRAAHLITNRLGSVGSSLCAEVSFDETVPELIISANGNRLQFDLVRQLVAAAPRELKWNVVALKPPRGFEFELSAPSGKIAAADLPFNPMRCPQRPEAFGIQLGFPHELADSKDARHLAQLVLQTGLGEEIASEIELIEIEDVSQTDCSEWISIADLKTYIEWKRERPN